MENQPLLDFLPVDADAIPFNDRVVCQLMIDAAHADLAWATAIFAEHGTTASGAGWEGLLVFYLQQVDPVLLSRAFVSSDAEVCTVEVPDEQSLEDLHRHVLTLMLDHKTLLQYLASVPDDYKLKI